MTTPPSPPPPPRRETDAAQAPAEPRPPAELWGIWSADTRHWQAAGFGDNYFAYGTREAAERSATRQQHAGNDVVAVLIGVSPAVREQRDQAIAALQQIADYDEWLENTIDMVDVGVVRYLQDLARVALLDLDTGGREKTETGEPS